MAREVITKQIEEEKITCDRCGKTLTEKDVNDFWFVAHGIGSWDMKEHVVYESGKRGDYCNDCLMKLQNKIKTIFNTVFTERYGDCKEKTPDERIWEMIDEEEQN